MKKIVSLGLLLTAAALLTGCQKKETPPVAGKTPAVAPVDKTAMGNMVTLSELQKGEVVRGKSADGIGAMNGVKTVNNSAAGKTEAAPVLSYNDVVNCDSGSCRVAELKDAHGKSESIKGMLRKIPLMNHGTAAVNPEEKEVFEEQRLMSGPAGNYNEIKLPPSRPAATAESKLPGSGHSQMPAKNAKSDLWPGGVPLETEIDPEVTGF